MTKDRHTYTFLSIYQHNEVIEAERGRGIPLTQVMIRKHRELNSWHENFPCFRLILASLIQISIWGKTVCSFYIVDRYFVLAFFFYFFFIYFVLSFWRFSWDVVGVSNISNAGGDGWKNGADYPHHRSILLLQDFNCLLFYNFVDFSSIFLYFLL